MQRSGLEWAGRSSRLASNACGFVGRISPQTLGIYVLVRVGTPPSLIKLLLLSVDKAPEQVESVRLHLLRTQSLGSN